MPRWLRLAPLAWLVACTAPPPGSPAPGEPAPAVDSTVAPAAVEPVAPVAPVAPVTPVAPVAPVEPVAAAPGEPVVRWWCVCYSRTAAVEAEPLTACRATEAECHSLERAVAAGHRGMVARSLTHPCSELVAAHPGDIHGGRGVWASSRKPGSWLSLGVCRLPGEGELIQAEGGPDPMREERFGELAINMPAAAVLERLGEPKRKDRIELSEATGDHVQTWFYPDQGLALGMYSDGRKGAQSIGAITVKAPSTLTSRLGVGIGSPRKAVLDAYGKMRDPMFPSGDKEDVFLAGSIYGGIFFTFKKDKVSEIFVGAGAE